MNVWELTFSRTSNQVGRKLSKKGLRNERSHTIIKSRRRQKPKRCSTIPPQNLRKTLVRTELERNPNFRTKIQTFHCIHHLLDLKITNFPPPHLSTPKSTTKQRARPRSDPFDEPPTVKYLAVPPLSSTSFSCHKILVPMLGDRSARGRQRVTERERRSGGNEES